MALFQIKNLFPYLKKPEKYIAENKQITLRSGWEISLAVDFLDKHSSVLEWTSETIVIPYKCPVRNGSIHRYFPDFWMKVKESTGTVKEYIIEVKPHAETDKPKVPKRVTKSYKTACETYMKNQAKWASARAYCASLRKAGRRIEFIIMTEKGIIYEDGRFEKLVFFKI